MTFGNEIGCDVKIINNLRTDTILFSETGGFILELSMNNMEAVQSIFSHHGIELIKIGSTNDSRAMVFNSVVKLSVKHAKDAWTNGLREKL
jgi:phosphoribosylformylglycinamidine synthase